MGSDPNQVRGRVSGRGRGRVKRVRVKVRVRVRVRVEGAARDLFVEAAGEDLHDVR